VSLQPQFVFPAVTMPATKPRIDKALLREITMPASARASKLVKYGEGQAVCYVLHALAHKATKGLTKITRCEIDDSSSIVIEGARPGGYHCGSGWIKTKLRLYPMSEQRSLGILSAETQAKPKVNIVMTSAMKLFEAEMNMQRGEY
jgi:hypothetical protein